MVVKGIVRKSTSNFSSPFIALKKKENSFGLCDDHRKLNCETYKQRFPFSVIA